MNGEQRKYLIPKRLDDPMKVMFWDYDVFLCFAVGLSLGIAIGTMLLGLGLGCGTAYLWSKARAGRHPGYAIHVVYWITPISLFRRTPPSARRVFYG
jgi:conjugal transfer pilus assembly protein TraL